MHSTGRRFQATAFDPRADHNLRKIGPASEEQLVVVGPAIRPR